jgi:hypothetical protein
MLFRKKMPKSCVYCTHGTKLNEDQVLCVKKGVVSIEGKCRKFRYDPCKRIPPRPKMPDFSQYSSEDFTL